jgi:F0F1-type ATP synthase membrane subunit b/b'
MRDTELKLSRDLAKSRDQIQLKDEAVVTLQQELSDARATAQQRSIELETSQQQLVEAEERYRRLDEHWKRSSATNVAKKIGSLSEEVRHEVQEAILSLDRDAPNLAMALNRLRRLHAIIERQKGPEVEPKQ